MKVKVDCTQKPNKKIKNYINDLPLKKALQIKMIIKKKNILQCDDASFNYNHKTNTHISFVDCIEYYKKS